VLVILGAVVSVLALAIDPFSQQVVRYYNCMQPIHGTIATVPRTNAYSRAGAHVHAQQVTLDNPMVAALYQGLVNPPKNASFIIPFSCETGNCTFPSDRGASYSSIGMCHSCRDINSTVFNSSTSDKSGWLWNTTSGAQIGMSVLLNTVLPRYGGEGDNDTELLTFDTLMIQEFYSGVTRGRWPWAVRCGLYPCVKTYAANISRFVLDEIVMETQPLERNWKEGGFILATDDTLRDGVWTKCTPSDQPTADNQVIVPFPTSGNTVPKNFTNKYYSEDCVWSFSYVALNGMSPYLASMFSGRVDSNYALWGNAQGDQWLVNLGHNGTANLSTAESVMEGLSSAITATMRQGGPNGTSAYAQGVAYASQTCVGARWAWLALPGALLVCAITFLAITIVQTSASQQVWRLPWKSSALALVMHSFDDETRHRIGYVDRLEEMREAARHMRTQLVPTEKGWRLVEQ
jgi:hypothetical protein